MRFAVLLLLVFAVACGNNSGSTNNNSSLEDRTDETRPDAPGTGSGTDSTVNPDEPDETTMEVEMVKPVDLGDATLDEQVTIDGNQIIFKKNSMNATEGFRNTCALSVAQGEAYKYQLNGDTLTLTAGSKTYQMNRTGAPGKSLVGSWIWSGKEGAMYKRLRLSVVNMNHVILNQHCEG